MYLKILSVLYSATVDVTILIMMLTYYIVNSCFFLKRSSIQSAPGPTLAQATHKVLSVDIASVLQEQVVLDEDGQIEFRNHLVYPALQEAPESEACQVLQGARSLCQREDGLIELFVLLVR